MKRLAALEFKHDESPLNMSCYHQEYPSVWRAEISPLFSGRGLTSLRLHCPRLTSSCTLWLCRVLFHTTGPPFNRFAQGLDLFLSQRDPQMNIAAEKGRLIHSSDRRTLSGSGDVCCLALVKIHLRQEHTKYDLTKNHIAVESVVLKPGPRTFCNTTKFLSANVLQLH
ncbi:hypothetical protein F2P81_006510 [Scophthalmus maximus]|uniref:Uncharacterized protein n=1 Tax=Scophthalmus maximus TaxID=52904 RepID=A0A6A4TE88_SCOMX|nr:hypothetical protein F2P81_006510 [Scophthalmus maximus]